MLKTVPEVEHVFGKAGRADTATDPAPLEMFETTITFKPKSEWRPGMTMEKLEQELDAAVQVPGLTNLRSEEHTSELQSLMRISYAVFCLKKKNKSNRTTKT